MFLYKFEPNSFFISSNSMKKIFKNHERWWNWLKELDRSRKGKETKKIYVSSKSIKYYSCSIKKKFYYRKAKTRKSNIVHTGLGGSV